MIISLRTALIAIVAPASLLLLSSLLRRLRRPARPSEAQILQWSSAAARTSTGDRKAVVITGANSGIGLLAADYFAGTGWHVIMACRNHEAGTAAQQTIKAHHPGAAVSLLTLDLASLRSVRQFPAALAALKVPLYLLINNAGLTGAKTRNVTRDGFELTFGTNHIGTFELTRLLVPMLAHTAADPDADVRVVMTASSTHDPARRREKLGATINFDNLQGESQYDGFWQYKNSKLANVLFTYELERRLQGTGVHALTFCPGLIPSTGLFRNFGRAGRFAFWFMMHVVMGFMAITRTEAEGAQTLVYTATAPALKGVGGRYISDCNERASSDASRDPALAAKLWEVTERLIANPPVSS